MSSSKLTTKYQTTIPKEIRTLLKLNAGDSIQFDISKEGVVAIRKAKPFDKEYLRMLNKTASEWETSNDEEAYEHLQNL